MYSRETRKPHIPTPADLDAACKKILPLAKRALAERGISAKKVEAMSSHQAALLYWLQLQHELTDEYVKAYALPYPQAIQGINSASLLAERAKADGRDIIALSSTMLPVMEASRTAVVRDDRRIAVLRVIEALRLHAASNGGKLPDHLADISEVPIPDDPVTTKPFDYHRDGDKASLQGPAVGDVPLQYEITMVLAK